MTLLHNLVKIRPEQPEETTGTGTAKIFLTGNTLKELPPFGEVVAVSAAIPDVKVGDRVSYAVYAGVPVEDDLVVVPYESVFEVLDEKKN